MSDKPGFSNVYCSQCGNAFGVNTSGYSACKEHYEKLSQEEQDTVEWLNKWSSKNDEPEVTSWQKGYEAARRVVRYNLLMFKPKESK